MYWLLRVVLRALGFALGLSSDLLVLPVAALLFGVKWMYPVDFDNVLPRNMDRPPILLIHGSGSSEAQWLLHRYLLHDQYAVYTAQLHGVQFGVVDKNTSLQEYADALSTKFQQIVDAHPNEPVTLAGVSMGGLVAASLALKHPEHVRKVITIGSPWQGAPLLDYISIDTQRHRDMTPNSKFLLRLNLEAALSRIHFVCVGSPLDPQVPLEYSHPSPSPNQATTIAHLAGHMSAMLSWTTWSVLYYY
jgi:pimeloyl-ACP methyl ester carboxylesterase